MIILRKEYVYSKPKRPELESSKVINIKLIKKDTGTSFADILGECEIEGHVTTTKYTKHTFGYKPLEPFTDWVERCEVCEMERDVRKYDQYSSKILSYNLIDERYTKKIEYGKWRPSPCYECEENCIINRPLEPKCPNCGSKKDIGAYHSNGDAVLLFDCVECKTRDQVIE